MESVYSGGNRGLSFYMELDLTKGSILTGNAFTSCLDQNYTLEQINDNTN